MGGLGTSRRLRTGASTRGRQIAYLVLSVSAALTGTVVATPVSASPPGAVNLEPSFPAPMAPATTAGIHLDPPGPISHSRHASGAGAAPSTAATSAPSTPVPTDSWTTFSHQHHNANGTFTDQLYMLPTFRNTAKGWVAIDPTVAPRSGDPTYGLSAENAIRPMRIGHDAGHLLLLQLDGGPVVIETPGLTLGTPTLSNGVVTFANVATDEDLKLAVTAGEIEIALVLKASDAPTQQTFHVSDPSRVLGKVSSDGHGGYRFATVIDGDVAVGLAPAYAYQPPVNRQAPVDLTPGSAHESVAQSAGGFDITVSVDSGWLRGKSFPVVLDPTATFDENTTGDMWGLATDEEESGGCGMNCYIHYQTTDLGVGQYAPYYQRNTFMKFGLGAIPPGSVVQDSALQSYVYACWLDPSNPSGTNLCQSTDYQIAFNALTGSWSNNNQTTTLAQGEALRSASPFTTDVQTHFYIPHAEATSPSCTTYSGETPPCFWWTTHNLTSEIQYWVNNPSANNGFDAYAQAVRASGTTTWNSFGSTQSIGGPVWRFTYCDLSTNVCYTANPPKLTVTYAPPPGAPANVTASAANQQATVTWTAANANGGTITNYVVQPYYASNGASAGSAQTVTTTTATFTGLTNGTAYYFSVYATDNGANGPAANSNTVTPNAQPVVQKLVDTLPETNYILPGQIATFRVRVSDPQSVSIGLNTITDTLPAGFAFTPWLYPASLTVAPQGGTAVPCGSACAISGSTLTYTANTTLQSGSQYLELAYTAMATDVSRGCVPSVNTATAANSTDSASASTSVIICEGGLGYETYWAYVNRSLGGGGQASVNVASGNLVVQQTDSTPIQAHGRLGFVIRRTYNSEDSAIATLPGTVGGGWQLNVSEADDIVGSVAGASALYIPGTSGSLDPLAITLIDRDGTRHVYDPNGLATSLLALSLSGTTPVGPSNVYPTLIPRVLTLAATAGTWNALCVDETFTPPPGVHMDIWRYIAVTSAASPTNCTPAPGTTPITVGYGAETTDRIRYEFAADGHLLDMADEAGNELQYTYRVPGGTGIASPVPSTATFGLLAAITEPSTGRSITFTETLSGTQPLTYTVLDPANRTTTYKLDGASPVDHLVEVDNPDGSVLHYAYGSSCDSAYGAATGAGANQMCSETDLRGDTTYFLYTTQSQDGYTYLMPRVSAITDRRESSKAPASRTMTTTVAYFNEQTANTVPYTQVDQATHRSRFASIDPEGRVGEIDEGNTSDTYLHQTLTTWDGNTDPITGQVTYCRKPDQAVDNNLCHVIRHALNSGATADEDTSFAYGDEGQVLEQHQCISGPASGQPSLPDCGAGNSLDTTFGYDDQYFEATTAPTSSSQQPPATPYSDTVTGSGTTNSASPPGGRARRDAATLFVVISKRQQLSPRGQVGTGYDSYLTTYSVDDNGGASPSVAQSTPCGSTQANTGLVCQVSGPVYDSNGDHGISTYQYNSNGERTLYKTPKQHADGDSGYAYTYYGNGDKDLTGTVSAGGWLKAVTDIFGNSVIYAYDPAGNRARIWDRDQTYGHQVSSYPSPGPGAYSQTLYGVTSGSPSLTNPWRYVVSQADQNGDTTVYTNDADGNHTAIRPPRGYAAGNSSYDIGQTFDANDNLLTTTTPSGTTTYGYDTFNNRISLTDPSSHVVVDAYDAVNRLQHVYWTRSPWPTDTSTVPSGCNYETTSADAPLPSGEIRCTNTYGYDGTDNKTGFTDGNAQTTTYAYDSAHRQISITVPRDGTNEITHTQYDADGHPTAVCPPLDISGSCGGDPHDKLLAYDDSGRLASTTVYRAKGQGETTSYTWDADGNPATVTDANGHQTRYLYDGLDRHTWTYTPRSSGISYWTALGYDSSGDVTSVQQQGQAFTGTGAEGDLVVDGNAGWSQSNPYVINSTGNFRNISLVNGGWIAAPYFTGSTGGTLHLYATGTVSICSGCGITADSRGPWGGATSAAGQPGAAGTGPGDGQGGSTGTTYGGAGGGAGHANYGTTTSPATGQGSSGVGGPSYGASDVVDSDTNRMGSGGGAGGSTSTEQGGWGGAGGGYIQLSANSIDVEGTITTNGEKGNDGQAIAGSVAGGGGGGGSAGDIWLQAPSITFGSTASVTANGGAGGASGGGHAGGAGSAGEIRIDANQTTGSTPMGAQLNSLVLITTHRYDAAHRMTDTFTGAQRTDAWNEPAETSSNNTHVHYGYDQDGHVIAVDDPRAFASTQDPTQANSDYITTIAYDTTGRPVTEYQPRYDSASGGPGDINPPGSADVQGTQCPTGATGYAPTTGVCVTAVQYNPDGTVKELDLPGYGSNSNRHISYAYTDDHLLASVDAPAPPGQSGRVTAEQYLYDGDFKQVRATDANGVQQVTAYYSDELVKSITGSPNGSITHVESMVYDGNGNLTKDTDPAGNATNISYTPDNLKSDVTDGASDDTQYVYDGVGNATSVFSPSAVAGDPQFPSKVATTNTYTYDNLLSSTTIPVTVTSSGATFSRQISYQYDAAGRRTETDYATVAAGNPPTTTVVGSQYLTYYDNGLQVGQIGEDGSTIVTGYDLAGHPNYVQDSTSAKTLGVSYYLDGNPRYVDDGNNSASDGGRRTLFAYDGTGNPTVQQETTDGGGSQSTTLYTYGDNGQLSWMKADAEGVQRTFTYDVGGRPLQQSDPSGQVEAWAYNVDNTLATKTLTSSGGALQSAWCYTWDADYRQSTQAFSTTSSTCAGSGDVKYTYGYDAASRVNSFGLSTGATYPITWDHNGNRTSYSGPTGVADGSFTYQADNSICSQYSGTAPGSCNYSYDGYGRLTKDLCTQYTYDGFDRLSSAQQLNGTVCPTAKGTATYTYDGRDRQISHQDAGATSPVKIHYDGMGSGILAEVPSNGTTEYATGPTGQPMGLKETSGTVQNLSTDGNGNVGLVSGGGSVTCGTRYDPFGITTAAGGLTACSTSNTQDDVFYRSARQDASTGQYQMGSRVYDPGKGAFLTPDVFRKGLPTAVPSAGADPLTANTYAYVNGDPVNLIDPTGHNPCRSEGVGGGGCTPQENATDYAYDRGATGPQARSAGRVVQARWDAARAASQPVHTAENNCPEGYNIPRASLHGLTTCEAIDTAASVMNECSYAYSRGTEQYQTCVNLAQVTIDEAFTFNPMDCFGQSQGHLDAFCRLAAESESSPDAWSVFTGGLKVTCAAVCAPIAGKVLGVVGRALGITGSAGAATAGSITVIGDIARFSKSELNAAQYFADAGNDVVLRTATGAGRTSDLVVNGTDWDVYTPNAGTTVRNIASNVGAKGSQVNGGGVFVDLSTWSAGPSAGQIADELAVIRQAQMEGNVGSVIFYYGG